MDDTWDEIIKELAPVRMWRGDKPKPYQPFEFQGVLLCAVPDEDVELGATMVCDLCDARTLKSCQSTPDCSGLHCHFERFTPEQYARLVAQQWRDNDAGHTPAESDSAAPAARD